MHFICELALQDLVRSEKELQHAYSLNADLGGQLKRAVEDNVAVQLQLEKSSAEIQVLADEAKLKEKEIEGLIKHCSDSCQQAASLTGELQQLKQGYGASLSRFYSSLNEVTELIKQDKVERTPTPRPHS